MKVGCCILRSKGDAAMPHQSSAYDHDVVIVGASFAGAACALAAAQYGLRVCVLERKADPGERLHTTGIVVKEAMEQTWLGRMPEYLVQRVANVRLYAPNLRSVLLAAPGYYFLTTDTPNLMRWLASELRANGVDLRLQQSFTDAHRSGDGWQVEGQGAAPTWSAPMARAHALPSAPASARCVTTSTASNVSSPASSCRRVTHSIASSASALHRATSAGSRRIQPACRWDWRCAMTRIRYARLILMASLSTCAMWSAFRLRRAPRLPVPAWCLAAGRMGRSLANG